MTSQTKNVVITRYNEYIDWIRYIIDKVDFIYIYNKGPNSNFFKHLILSPEQQNKISIEQLENIGRIDHTLTHHILKYYDNLPDILINLPGSVMMSKNKGYYLNAIMRRLDNLSRYSGFFAPRFHRVSPKFNYTIDNYQAEGACNRNNNPFIKSEYPDFRAWKLALIDDRPMRYIGMRGMFAVGKENITHIKKEIYEKLLISLSVGDNIENGHFAERIWAHLFRQYSFDKQVKTIETVTAQINRCEIV
jgi:hypothetical protein